MVKFNYTILLSLAIIFTTVSCIENAGVVANDNVTDNKSDNITTFLTFDFESVPTGKIKEMKLTYTGEETVLQIAPSYGDITMLRNDVAPSYSTTCGGDNDSSKRLTLTPNCVLAYSISPAQAKNYAFTIPTNKGNIDFKAVGTVASSTSQKITLDQISYTMKSMNFAGQKIYYDNITLTQDGGGIINASFVFAKTNVDPAIARFLPDTDNYYLSVLFPLDSSSYCTYSSVTKTVSGPSGCKVLMVFYVTPEDQLEAGKFRLQNGTYEAAIGFLTNNETLGNASTITIKYP